MSKKVILPLYTISGWMIRAARAWMAITPPISIAGEFLCCRVVAVGSNSWLNKSFRCWCSPGSSCICLLNISCWWPILHYSSWCGLGWNLLCYFILSIRPPVLLTSSSRLPPSLIGCSWSRCRHCHVWRHYWHSAWLTGLRFCQWKDDCDGQQ